MQLDIDPKIIARFSELPKVVQDLITDSGWQFKIRDLIKKYGIRIDQGGTIEHEIFLVMLGFDDAENFISNVAKETGLDRKIVTSLAQDVESLIFNPIKQALIEQTDAAVKYDAVDAPQSDIESRDDILKQIEDPSEIPVASVMPTPKTAPINAPTPSVSQTTPAPSTPTPSTPKIDPYREPIE